MFPGAPPAALSIFMAKEERAEGKDQERVVAYPINT
jgi:hypothetical protein